MENGYIKLWRKLQFSKFWMCEKFTRGQAWIDLLILANHKDGGFFLRGIWVDIKRGQVGYSEKTLAARWRWSRTKTRAFISVLEKEHQIKQQKSNLMSLITIVNYTIYQEQKTPKKTPEKTPERHQKDTNKNDKNDKNDKNNTPTFKVQAPDWLDSILFNDFLEHRKKLRKPMTERAKEIFVRKVDNLRSKGFDPTELIETAIERGWQTVFEPKDENKSKKITYESVEKVCRRCNSTDWRRLNNKDVCEKCLETERIINNVIK